MYFYLKIYPVLYVTCSSVNVHPTYHWFVETYEHGSYIGHRDSWQQEGFLLED